MDENNETLATHEKEKVKFYRLDKSKPYKCEGGVSRSNINFLIVLGSLFIIGALVFAIVARNSIAENPVTITGCIFLCVFGGVFLAMGISAQVKNNRQRAQEQAVLNDCVLTDGQITECSCVTHRHSGKNGHSHTSYEVSLVYTYFDEQLNPRTGRFHRTYSQDPQFYQGQYLMIAFNAYDSLIMREFTLEGGDMNAFLENEAARSNDDFDSLTGEELDGELAIDTSKPIKALDGSFMFLAIGLSLAGFLCVYAIIVGAVIVPVSFVGNFNGGVDVGVIFTIVAFSIMPCIIIAFAIVCFVKYFKYSRPFKRLMKNNPRFTFGKMFASESTFRGKSKKVIYCYIDKWGEKHTEQIEAPLFQSEVQGKEKRVVVAYDAKGNSAVLSKYSFKEH